MSHPGEHQKIGWGGKKSEIHLLRKYHFKEIFISNGVDKISSQFLVINQQFFFATVVIQYDDDYDGCSSCLEVEVSPQVVGVGRTSKAQTP